MHIRILRGQVDLDRYERWVRTHPAGNFWQSAERISNIEACGKRTVIYVAEEEDTITASALVVLDSTALNLSVWEIPRGPLWNEQHGVQLLMEKIRDDAKDAGCLALFLSPALPLPCAVRALRPSGRHVHCEATRIVDLTRSEEEILSQMKQKGRYNIKVAEKAGITVCASEDIESFYGLIEKTGGRDGFTHHARTQYDAFLRHLPGAFLLLAYPPPESPQVPIAGVLSVIWGSQGIYYYGASDHEYRALMAPYALQWESMKLCKNKGCTQYDLLGIAPTDADEHHPWAGISVFKEKFGGTVLAYPPEHVLILRPWVWRMLQMKRRLWR